VKTISINNLKIGSNNPVFIIAEIGINHQGEVAIAKQLISAAKESGADCVKFQKRTISRILTKAGLDMIYENPNSFGKTYGEHKKVLELSDEDYYQLKKYSEKLDLVFCASGWDEESIDFLDKLGVSFFKMASADLTNFPLLEHTAKIGKPMFLSTGMTNMQMVKNAYEFVHDLNDQIVILQCTSTYPSAFNEINLNVLKTYADEFNDAVIGYSGHELGIAIPPAAVAMGAKIIERHFTLDRTMKGNDHAASLEPQGFSKMVRDIRHIEKAMGSFEKTAQESEKPIFKKLAKSIVSVTDIDINTIITREMLTTKGPGTGISPTRINDVIGKKSITKVPRDTVIEEGSIEW